MSTSIAAHFESSLLSQHSTLASSTPILATTALPSPSFLVASVSRLPSASVKEREGDETCRYLFAKKLIERDPEGVAKQVPYFTKKFQNKLAKHLLRQYPAIFFAHADSMDIDFKALSKSCNTLGDQWKRKLDEKIYAHDPKSRLEQAKKDLKNDRTLIKNLQKYRLAEKDAYELLLKERYNLSIEEFPFAAFEPKSDHLFKLLFSQLVSKIESAHSLSFFLKKIHENCEPGLTLKFAHYLAEKSPKSFFSSAKTIATIITDINIQSDLVCKATFYIFSKDWKQVARYAEDLKKFNFSDEQQLDHIEQMLRGNARFLKGVEIPSPRCNCESTVFDSLGHFKNAASRERLACLLADLAPCAVYENLSWFELESSKSYWNVFKAFAKSFKGTLVLSDFYIQDEKEVQHALLFLARCRSVAILKGTVTCSSGALEATAKEIIEIAPEFLWLNRKFFHMEEGSQLFDQCALAYQRLEAEKIRIASAQESPCTLL